MKRYYIGITRKGYYLIFSELPKNVTEERYRYLFTTCIGPFKTKQGAIYMQDHGRGNPHLQTVEDAERLAKENR